MKWKPIMWAVSAAMPLGWGCHVQGGAAVKGATASAAGGEAKSIAAWREEIEKRAEEEQAKKSPALRRLELGCAVELFGSGGDGRTRIPMVRRNGAARQEFVEWRKGEGERWLREFMAGTLSDEAKPYRWLLSAIWIHEGRLAQAKARAARRSKQEPSLSAQETSAGKYADRVLDEGCAVMRAAYHGEKLTLAQIDRLRELRILDDRVNGGEQVSLPFHLGLSARNRQPRAGRFCFYEEPGEIAPDFYLPFLDTVLKRPGYTDYPEYDMAEPLQWRGLLKYFRLFARYTTTTDEEGRQIVVPKPYTVAAGDPPAGYVRLSSFRGKKPVVLMVVRMSDGYWYRIRSRDMAYLHQAYGDSVQFLIVHTTYGDDSAAIEEYFGPDAPGVSGVMWQNTQEERAREAKLICMSDSFMNIPVVIDDQGCPVRNAYAARGGSGEYCLIDKDGKIAYSFARGIGVRYDYSGGNAYANCLEAHIRELLRNDGRLPPGSTSSLWEANEKATTTAKRRTVTLDGATIAAVDKERKRLVVEKSLNGQSERFDVEIGPWARLWGYSTPYERRLLTFEDLRQGRKISLTFWDDEASEYKKYSPPGSDTRRMTVYQMTARTGKTPIVPRAIYVLESPKIRALPVPEIGASGIFWLVGDVVRVDAARRQLTVRTPRLAPQETYGYRFWKEAGDKARPTEMAKRNLDVVRTWVEGDDEERTRTLVLDEGVEIFVNGMHSLGFTAIRPGDKIGALYLPGEDEKDGLIYPSVLRVRSMP
jgi:hypothetical protein